MKAELSFLRTLVVMLAAMFVISSTPAFAQEGTRIINGTPGFTSTYPWMARVTVFTPDYEGDGGCGGSLIAPGWVLTAAHCFLDDTLEAIDLTAVDRTHVLLNSDTEWPQAPGSFFVKAKQVILHPGYDPDPLTSLNDSDNDIALIELESPINLPTLALMTGSNLPDDTETIVMGWGTTGVDGNNESINPSNDLLQAQQKIVSSSDCNLIYDGQITDNMICGGAVQENDTTDTCQGDSGGPMLVNTQSGFIQVGIVSFGGTETGPVCGDPDAPGVYARVSQYESFINQYVAGATFKPVAPLQFNCGNSSIDNLLNLTIPCLAFNGTTFSASFIFTDTANLFWQWNGMLGQSGCSSSSPACAVLDNDLNITVPGVIIGSNSYTVQFEYASDASINGKHLWRYLNHY